MDSGVAVRVTKLVTSNLEFSATMLIAARSLDNMRAGFNFVGWLGIFEALLLVDRRGERWHSHGHHHRRHNKFYGA